jgi:hypothetical protein
MAKLKDSSCEMILRLAGGVIGDKGFIGTDYIITPVRKPEIRDLYISEHDAQQADRSGIAAAGVPGGGGPMQALALLT